MSKVPPKNMPAWLEKLVDYTGKRIYRNGGAFDEFLEAAELCYEEFRQQEEAKAAKKKKQSKTKPKDPSKALANACKKIAAEMAAAPSAE